MRMVNRKTKLLILTKLNSQTPKVQMKKAKWKKNIKLTQMKEGKFLVAQKSKIKKIQMKIVTFPAVQIIKFMEHIVIRDQEVKLVKMTNDLVEVEVEGNFPKKENLLLPKKCFHIQTEICDKYFSLHF